MSEVLKSQTASKRTARLRVGAGLVGVAASTGLLLAGAGIAHADDTVNGTSNNVNGLLSGNDLAVPLQAPAQVCGADAGAQVLSGADGANCTMQAPPAASAPAPGTPAVPASAPSPKLAKTGAKTDELGLTGVSLLVTGAALVTYSRRRRRTS